MFTALDFAPFQAGPTEWLLEPENPSVRYLTLTALLDRQEDDPQVAEARAAMPMTVPTLWGGEAIGVAFSVRKWLPSLPTKHATLRERERKNTPV